MRRGSSTSEVAPDPASRSPPGRRRPSSAAAESRCTASKTGSSARCSPDGSALVFCTYFGTTDYNIVRDIDIDSRPEQSISPPHRRWRSRPATPTSTAPISPPRKAGLDCVVAETERLGVQLRLGHLPRRQRGRRHPAERAGGWAGQRLVHRRRAEYQHAAGKSDPGNEWRRSRRLSRQALARWQPTPVCDLPRWLRTGGLRDPQPRRKPGTGDIYVGSATSSTDLPVTANALQPGPGGGGHATG